MDVSIKKYVEKRLLKMSLTEYEGLHADQITCISANNFF